MRLEVGSSHANTCCQFCFCLLGGKFSTSKSDGSGCLVLLFCCGEISVYNFFPWQFPSIFFVLLGLAVCQSGVMELNRVEFLN